MPCLVSLTGKDDDFQSLSWATWATFTPYLPCSKAGPVTFKVLVCKTGFNGFESRRYLHFSKMLKHKGGLFPPPQ